jgi:hypothetical protein
MVSRSFIIWQKAKLEACHIYGLTVTCNPRFCDEAQVESDRGSAA